MSRNKRAVAYAKATGCSYTTALRYLAATQSDAAVVYCADCDTRGIETVMLEDPADGGHICPICDHAGRVLAAANTRFAKTEAALRNESDADDCSCTYYVVDHSDPERFHPENLDREDDPACPVHGTALLDPAVSQEDADAPWTSGATPLPAIGTPAHTHWLSEFTHGRLHLHPDGTHLDLNHDPHVLISGYAGTGKSTLIDLIKHGSAHAPSAVEVIHVDPHELDAPLQSARDALLAADDELKRRITLIRSLSASHLRHLRAAASDGTVGIHPNSVPGRLIVVIEELAGLLSAPPRSPDAQQAIAQVLHLAGQITRFGRAVEVNLVLSSQRGTLDTLPGELRNNLTTRIAYGRLSPEDSTTVFGDTRAAVVPRDGLPKGIARVTTDDGSDWTGQTYLPPKA